MPEFELLCDDLHLTAELEDEDQLNRLKDWHNTHVSQDITFSGSPRDQYESYLNAAKRYTNTFLDNKLSNMTAIQYAARHGYDRYISSQASGDDAFNQLDKDGMTPLHWAAYNGYAHTVEVLLNKGADACIPNKNAQLPIHSTLLVPMLHNKQIFSHKQDVFNILFKRAPKSIEHEDNSGDTVFHLMAGDEHFNGLLKEFLISNPPALSRPNKQMHYPIHTAILNNKIKNVALLLESGTGTSMQIGSEKRVAIHYAAQYGSEEMINLCIAHSKDLNVRDTYNKTPLILAAECGNHMAMSALLHHGANPDCLDCNKRTFNDYIKYRQQHEF